MNKILNKIIELSRDIQGNNRAFYKARIIEFLADLLRAEDEATGKSIILAFLKWLDSSDREQYMKLLCSINEYREIVNESEWGQ